jgi:response regulator RpfG family c-di-GMP phosphodiesterase
MANCLFIGNQEEDLLIFKSALGDVFPGSCCYTSDNGLEAISIMDEYDIVPDFIFLELDGNGNDAIWFLQAIRRMDVMRGVPVIVHSPTPQPEKVEMLKNNGALAIYFKAYDYTGICNVLNLYIGYEYANYQLN